MRTTFQLIIAICRLFLYAWLGLFILIAGVSALTTEWGVAITMAILALIPLALVSVLGPISKSLNEPNAHEAQTALNAKQQLIQSLLVEGESILGILETPVDEPRSNSLLTALTHRRLIVSKLVTKKKIWKIANQESLYYDSITSLKVESLPTDRRKTPLLSVVVHQGQSIRTIVGKHGPCSEFSKKLDELLHKHSGRNDSPIAISSELSSLHELKLAGVLSEEDWERCKNQFLGAPPDKAEQAVVQLKRLHELQKSGTISTSEFNMTKWEILSRQS